MWRPAASLIGISRAQTCSNGQAGDNAGRAICASSGMGAPAVALPPSEAYENWLEARRYLNMNDLTEHKKTDLRKAA